MPCPTIASEASRILKDALLGNQDLKLPEAIKSHIDSVKLTPEDATPSIPTPAKISESSTALWALLGLFSAVISEKRYNLPKQEVTVDIHSATLYTMSALVAQVNGKPVFHPEVLPRALYLDIGNIRQPYRSLASNVYKTKDGRYFHLHGSLNTTNTLHMLDLPQYRDDLTVNDKEKIKDIYRKAVGEKTAEWLDIEANEFWRQPGTICYTEEEFRATPHGKASWDEPLYEIHNAQKSLPPVPWPKSQDSKNRPLHGIKVLDLTRVIAGPSISKNLALMGADVLRISSKTIPEASVLMFDTQVGKRDAELNLKTKDGKLRFRQLIEEADVILDGFRPGALERLGFGQDMVHEIARRRGKGIIYGRENTYGWRGPWSDRCGYQQISDCVTGVSWAQGRFLGLNEPVVPLLPNSDYQTGIIGAICISQALYQRNKVGGSYNVDTSLNQFNIWYLKLGLHNEDAISALKQKDPDFMARHDTDLFTMVELTKRSLERSHGSSDGELFDPKRFTSCEMRWGQDNDTATILDWTKIVQFSANGSKVTHGYDHGSSMPGVDSPSW